ncbi:unnamed protein product [Chrysodeixis includens]|uniref:Uncharacterized protein n=1 Tax=Chrysodeixis includens TaxID=689277 RepID=A0A9P0FXA0_CHRIL|nr:unnamed protein product [Chrysodeixis includens]
MSVIAVKGIPLPFNLNNVVKALFRVINGHFEALNFEQGKLKGQKFKTCYLRISEKLDPVRVVERINSCGVLAKKFRPCAFIPTHVPDLPLATKPRKLSQKMSRILKIPDDDSPEKVLNLSNSEILTELQIKYPGLYHLSKKGSHQLLKEIAKKIMDRLKEIERQHPEAVDSAFRLTQYYRRMHPHFGDFQLVLSTLHALQDAARVHRTQLHEHELAAVPPHPYVFDNLPYAEVQKACAKYSDRIVSKITEHVKNLKSDVSENDTEDELVRKKVREELKKMAPFMPQIVNQVVSKHFIPQKSPFYRVRIYGEPFLPSKDTMAPFVRRYQPVHIMRASRMYNSLRLSVPQAHYAGLMAMDGTVLNGAKLVIRSSDIPLYKIESVGNENMEGDWVE